MSVISWADFLREILPPGTDGVLVVIENTCDGAFSYRIDGPAVTYLGSGSQLESKFADMVMVDDHLVHDFENSGLRLNEDGECTYQIFVGPSETFEDEYTSREPLIFTIAVAMVFVFTALLFGE